MKLSFLETAQRILESEKKPLTTMEMWRIIELGNYKNKISSKSKTPWISLEKKLISDIRNNPNSVFTVLPTDPKTFALQLPEMAGDDYYLIAVLDEGFIKGAKNAFRRNNKTVGIVLLATAIEQTVNTDYRLILTKLGLFTDEEITEIIRSNNIAPKIGWLLTLISGYKLDDKLRKRVLKLMELRNQIVHYKAIPSSENRKHVDPWRNMKSADIENLITLPDELIKAFNEAFETFNN